MILQKSIRKHSMKVKMTVGSVSRSLLAEKSCPKKRDSWRFRGGIIASGRPQKNHVQCHRSSSTPVATIYERMLALHRLFASTSFLFLRHQSAVHLICFLLHSSGCPRRKDYRRHVSPAHWFRQQLQLLKIQLKIKIINDTLKVEGRKKLEKK